MLKLQINVKTFFRFFLAVCKRNVVLTTSHSFSKNVSNVKGTLGTPYFTYGYRKRVHLTTRISPDSLILSREPESSGDLGGHCR